MKKLLLFLLFSMFSSTLFAGAHGALDCVGKTDILGIDGQLVGENVCIMGHINRQLHSVKSSATRIPGDIEYTHALYAELDNGEKFYFINKNNESVNDADLQALADRICKHSFGTDSHVVDYSEEQVHSDNFHDGDITGAYYYRSKGYSRVAAGGSGMKTLIMGVYCK